jgi:phage baseplate assembly protein W
MDFEKQHVDFLGRGWRFPIAAQLPGQIETSADESLILQSIWLILATAPGERVMRPDFGCGIHQLVFAVNDPATLRRAEDMVRNALIRWEPRIDVHNVSAESRGTGELLLINVRYLVRSTNNLFNFVYPFYLRGFEIE